MSFLMLSIIIVIAGHLLRLIKTFILPLMNLVARMSLSIGDTIMVNAGFTEI